MSSGRSPALATTPAEPASAGSAAAVPATPPHVLPDFAAGCAVALSDRGFDTIALPDFLRNAAPKRQAEYRAGRFCASMALGRIGYAADPRSVGRGPRGEPIWPEGVTGSITHAGTLAWAAVARTEHALALGIDSERIVEPQQAARLAGQVLLPSEVSLGGDSVETGLRFTLVFSAKEAIYKCLFPVVRAPFYFPDVEVKRFDRLRGTFAAEVRRTLGSEFEAGRTMEGRFVLDGGHLHTSVWVPARPGPAR